MHLSVSTGGLGDFPGVSYYSLVSKRNTHTCTEPVVRISALFSHWPGLYISLCHFVLLRPRASHLPSLTLQ